MAGVERRACPFLLDAIPSSRTKATESGPKRPLVTTEITTLLLPDDADLATVIEAWRDLPEAIHQGIVAMVRASKK
jgi:hypothetical protein